jgi:hypothetical protein
MKMQTINAIKRNCLLISISLPPSYKEKDGFAALLLKSFKTHKSRLRLWRTCS